jgi:predicted GIY-YIG superfamily endonuclease
VYVEEVADHSAALKREAQIKGYTHARKAALADAHPLPDVFKPAD